MGYRWYLLLLVALVHLSLQATPSEWRKRSIYQVVTDRFARSDGSNVLGCDDTLGQYCGGSWKGIVKQLDYIQGMGFDAIWISPITKQLEGETPHFESYHGYWQQDLTSHNQHFGTPDDLKDLSDELHKRGMYLMIDIVVGQMAWNGSRTSVDYGTFKPFDEESFFHPPSCLTADAGNNQTAVQQCWLGDDDVSLPDLRTEDDDVAEKLYSFVTEMVNTYSADGIRVDSAINLPLDFLAGVTKAAGVYTLGEVLQGNTTDACTYENSLDGILNYPLYFPLIRVFSGQGTHVYDLIEELNLLREECTDPTLLGTFSENHDKPRLAAYTDDMSLASNALTFDILFDGIPVIYYGQEQHFSGKDAPENREPLWPSGYDQDAPLYKLAGSLNLLRHQAIKTNGSYLDYLTDTIFYDDRNVAFRKGYDGNQIITVLNNNGASADGFELTISGTGFEEGANVTDVVSCISIIAGSNGTIAITISEGMPAVFASAALVDDAASCDPARARAQALASASASATVAQATSTATPSIVSSTGPVITATSPRHSNAPSHRYNCVALFLSVTTMALALAV